jgi:hypothetical protein
VFEQSYSAQKFHLFSAKQAVAHMTADVTQGLIVRPVFDGGKIRIYGCQIPQI